MCLLLRRRDSLLLREDNRELYGDSERSTNLPSLGSLVGSARRPCPLTGGTTTIHFMTAITRLMIELGRLHRGIVSKVHHVMLLFDIHLVEEPNPERNKQLVKII